MCLCSRKKAISIKESMTYYCRDSKEIVFLPRSHHLLFKSQFVSCGNGVKQIHYLNQLKSHVNNTIINQNCDRRGQKSFKSNGSAGRDIWKKTLAMKNGGSLLRSIIISKLFSWLRVHLPQPLGLTFEMGLKATLFCMTQWAVENAIFNIILLCMSWQSWTTVHT